MAVERVPLQIFEDDEQASLAVAGRIAELVRQKNSQGKPTVLGLATGHTPVNVYKELIRLHSEESLDFLRVVTFNLDEYWPINPEAIQSYRSWMQDNFFDHINIRPENIHVPRGDCPEEKIEEHCRDYERLTKDAGGIDLQILGIGRSGHIGFNEPGSGRNSRTRLIHLDKVTRKDAAGDFFGEGNVPQTAITMGVGTILESREICLLAFGEQKALIVKRAVEGKVAAHVAASFLQEHPNTTFYVDVAAAAKLERIATPWLFGACKWDEQLTVKAVIWLARTLKKPINKLTAEDYGENALAGLLKSYGSVQDLNRHVFRRLMATITTRPAGKDDRHTVMIFSPHPDDDVICMGGSICRMLEQRHDVHIAYMVSGYLSVFDHDVQRYADFAKSFNRIFDLDVEQSARIEQHIDKFLLNKNPGEPDTPEIQAIKALIRQGEAIDAARYCGVPESNIHFLDMPFYQTGKVQKLSISEEDITRILEVLNEVRPEIIFAAGDMSDPHGTHRLCQQAGLAAFERYKAAGNAEPVLWLYRGAWQEWEPEQIEMVIPLSPEELKRKRYAIFRHQSQKDRAMFPGPYDNREFWQRAEDRNKTTSAIYDELGLPEYHALEAFVRHPVKLPAAIRRQLTRVGGSA